MINQTSDADWFALLRQGEEDAFDHFYEVYYVSLVRYADGITGDEAEAEDIAIEAFMGLCKEASSLESPDHLRNFLYLVVKRRALDYLRRQKRLKTCMQLYLKEEGPGGIYPDPDMEFEILKEAVLEELDKVAEEVLSPELMKVFLLNQRKRMPAAEIALVLGKSPHTVSKQLGRIRELLVEHLDWKNI